MLIGTEPASMEQQRDNWMETARQHAINEEYFRFKRFELLKWIKTTAEFYPEFDKLVPDTIREQFKLTLTEASDDPRAQDAG